MMKREESGKMWEEEIVAFCNVMLGVAVRNRPFV